MKEKLMIIGAGGHGRVCAEIAKLAGYQQILFLDDDPALKSIVYGTISDFEAIVSEYAFFVAIGDNAVRKRIFENISGKGGSFATLVHPESIISKSAVIGEGTVIMPGVVVSTDVRIGRGVIINTCSSVDHNSLVDDYSHIAVGAHLAGSVKTGKSVLIGAGATVVNNISICENVIIGAGAVVIGNIEKQGKYYGVPAKVVLK